MDGTRPGAGPPGASELALPTAQSAGSDLIERDGELDARAVALARLEGRVGGVVTVKARAGLGKTTLVEHPIARAAGAGLRVRTAAPGPQERHFAFGVMRTLLEAPLHDADGAERARLLDGAAAPAGDLLLRGTAPGPDATTSIAHSMLWLCTALTDGAAPLLLVIDDAHWADRPSLEVISYLARRMMDAPVLIVLAFRPDVPEAASDLLSLIDDGRFAESLSLQPLTVAGSAELVRRSAPAAPLDVCRRCHDAAHGNPWLVGELGHQVASHGPSSLNLPGAPDTTVRALARDVIARRLAALSPVDRAVSAALAVLGDGAPSHVVAAVAGVSRDALSASRDALASAGLLGPDARGLAHALIAAAILENLPRAESERLHRDAARSLSAEGAESDVVAGHLLRCAPSGDRAASAVLREAATHALARGAPHAAAAYLSARWTSERPATTGARCWPRWRWRPSTRACPGRVIGYARPSSRSMITPPGSSS